MKIEAVVHRDENLFPTLIEIKKGRKKLKIKQTPSPLGDVYSLVLEGRRDVMPSFSEIFSILNARRLDRIGTIEKVDTIDSIGQIGSIGEWAAGNITYSIMSLLAAGKSDTIDSNSLDIIFYSLEFATNYKDMILQIKPRLADEYLAAKIQIAEKDGTGRVDYTPSNINTHKSNLFEELIYDEANNYYKFALKYALRFGNGYEIKVTNPDSVAHNYVFESMSLRKT